MATGAVGGPVTARQVFGRRAFAVPYIAETQSLLGDQVARFALSVLVFDDTHSATAAALTYATSFIPAILGGFVLGRLGDRFARRRVMIAADLIRAGLFLAMAVPSVPVWALMAILAVAVFVGPAYSSAEVGFLSVALDDEQFRIATAIRSASYQLTVVFGIAVGGLVVVWLDPHRALLINAATFAFSAILIAIGLPGVRPREQPSADHPAETDSVAEEFPGLWRSRRTRPYMVLTVLMGLFVLPEALAVPFGRQIGASTVQTALLIAMIPLGSAVGASVIVRTPQTHRDQIAAWMAVGCGLPMLVNAAHPDWPLACACWFVSGVLAAYEVEALTVLVRSAPESTRSAHVGVIGAWLLGAQGVAFALAGALAPLVGIGAAMAVAAGFGSLCALGQASGLVRY